MRTMYDSVTASDIPLSADMVGGYVDGDYAWSQAAWDRFPNAVKVRIATRASTNDGHVLDCETGDAVPGQTGPWAKMRIGSGLSRPTIYCNRSARPAVEQSCAGLPVTLWIATLDGTKQVPAGPLPVVAVQYIGEPGSGGHYDLSEVYDDTWPYSAAPLPQPVPHPGDNVIQYTGAVTLAGGKGWFKLPAGVSAANVVSVTVYDQSPDAVGAYVPVPDVAGIATDRNEIVFRGGVDSPQLSGTFGFAYWVSQ